MVENRKLYVADGIEQQKTADEQGCRSQPIKGGQAQAEAIDQGIGGQDQEQDSNKSQGSLQRDGSVQIAHHG